MGMNTNEITVSLNEIRAKSPCTDGWRKVLAAKGPDMEAQFPLADIIETNDFNYALWALRCRPEYNNLWRKYAVWCARQVEHLLTDDRSVEALDVAWRHSEGSATDEELAAYRAAAQAAVEDADWDASGAASSDASGAASSDAAWSASRAAAGAAYRAAASAAASAVASDAVWAADWSASRAAAGAAVDADRDAARAAAGAAQRQKLIEILNAGEWV